MSNTLLDGILQHVWTLGGNRGCRGNSITHSVLEEGRYMNRTRIPNPDRLNDES